MPDELQDRPLKSMAWDRRRALAMESQRPAPEQGRTVEGWAAVSADNIPMWESIGYQRRRAEAFAHDNRRWPHVRRISITIHPEPETER